MIIRPISDLRNKYPEIEKIVLEEEKEVYLTKNGYGSMVVVSLEKYSELLEQVNKKDLFEKELDEFEKEFGNVDIDKELEEADKEIDDPNTEFLTGEEVFGKIRRMLNEPEQEV